MLSNENKTCSSRDFESSVASKHARAVISSAQWHRARTRAYPCSEDRRTEPGVQSESRPEHSVFEQLFRMKLEQRCRAPQRGRLSKPEHQRSRASSSCHFERPSEAERTRAANVSASAKPSGPEQRFRPPQRSRAGSCCHFERPSDAEGARAAISSAPATPTGLELLFRSPQRLRGWLEQRFRAPQRLRGGLERPFRAPLRPRAGSSSHFERSCGSERARAAILSAQRLWCGK